MVRPTGFEPAAYRVGVIKPSSRKALRRKGLIGVAQISAILKKTSEALQDKASEVFCDSSQIVVCAGHMSRSSIQLSDPTGGSRGKVINFMTVSFILLNILDY